jgi:hypothetical protein
MNNRILLTLVIMFLITNGILLSQDNDFSSLIGQTHKGRILLNNNSTIESDEITASKNFLIYKSKNSSLDSVNLDEVRFLRIKYGSYAFEGSLLGALLGLTTVMLYDLAEGNGLNAPPEAIGAFVGIGAGVGLITGLFYSKQITIYKKGQLQLSLLEPFHQKLKHIQTFKLVNLSINL